LSQVNAAEAQSVIRSSQDYADLTLTLYASSLEWLVEVGAAVVTKRSVALTPELNQLPALARSQLLFELALAHQDPPWLHNADVIAMSDEDPPADAVQLAFGLGLSPSAASVGVRRVFGRIDLEQRAEIGAAGEAALASALDSCWPACVNHVALVHDGFGYDVSLVSDNIEWHLEVKSTLRRGRLIVYVSRQEWEVGHHDPFWRMAIVGLDSHFNFRTVVTVDTAWLIRMAPADRGPEARWTSARFEISRDALSPGLPFLSFDGVQSEARRTLKNGGQHGPEFDWWPRQRYAPAIESSSMSIS
jgi:hypothetical protein